MMPPRRRSIGSNSAEALKPLPSRAELDKHGRDLMVPLLPQSIAFDWTEAPVPERPPSQHPALRGLKPIRPDCGPVQPKRGYLCASASSPRPITQTRSTESVGSQILHRREQMNGSTHYTH
jgi:hypothetical protein